MKQINLIIILVVLVFNIAIANDNNQLETRKIKVQETAQMINALKGNLNLQDSIKTSDNLLYSKADIIAQIQSVLEFDGAIIDDLNHSLAAKTTELDSLQTIFNSNTNELNAQLEKQKGTQLYSLIGAGAIFLITLIVFFAYMGLKKKNKKAIKEITDLKNQIKEDGEKLKEAQNDFTQKQEKLHKELADTINDSEKLKETFENEKAVLKNDIDAKTKALETANEALKNQKAIAENMQTKILEQQQIVDNLVEKEKNYKQTIEEITKEKLQLASENQLIAEKLTTLNNQINTLIKEKAEAQKKQQIAENNIEKIKQYQLDIQKKNDSEMQKLIAENDKLKIQLSETTSNTEYENQIGILRAEVEKQYEENKLLQKSIIELNEANVQMANQLESVKAFNQQNDNNNVLEINELKDENERLKAEINHIKEINQSLNNMKTELEDKQKQSKELLEQKQLLEDKIDALMRQNQQLKEHTEALIETHKQQSENKDNEQVEMHNIMSTLNQTKDTITNKETEISQLKNDLHAYKFEFQQEIVKLTEEINIIASEKQALDKELKDKNKIIEELIEKKNNFEQEVENLKESVRIERENFSSIQAELNGFVKDLRGLLPLNNKD